MPITVTCACGQSYLIREEFAGQRVQCPSCSQMPTIPAPAVGARRPQELDELEIAGVIDEAEEVRAPNPVRNMSTQPVSAGVR
jgi:hypothetical protein